VSNRKRQKALDIRWVFAMVSPLPILFRLSERGLPQGRGQIMRKFLWLAGLALGMAWAGPAHAQTSGTSTLTNILQFPKNINITVQPNIINNSPMDYRNLNAPIATTTYRPNTTGTAFPYRLSSMFYQPSRTNFISSSTTFGTSFWPTPAQMQAAAPNYFKPFQMYRAAPIQP
jgi:hypothetical protein